MPFGNALPVPGWVGGDGNAAYLDKTLRHEQVETALDDRVSGRTVLQLWLRAALISWIALLVQLPFLIMSLAGSTDSGQYGESSGSSIGGFALFVVFDVPVIFLLVLFCGKLTEPIGEWRVLLENRSEQDVQSTYYKICGVVARRSFPLGVNYRRLKTGYGAQQSNGRLALSNGDCEAVISVFRYGDSLYLGWQMWRTRRGWRLIARFVGDSLGSVFGQADLAWAMLRTENVRAMREAVHAVCREGLVTAIEREEVPEQFGFGGGRAPQVEHPRTSGPVAAAAPAPAPYLERATAAAPAPVPGPVVPGPVVPGPVVPGPVVPAPAPEQPQGPPTIGDGWSTGEPARP
ncbi:hypothetical protein OG500_12450 [Kitasatospora sp. NBC_01250]|uniref:hypothetical protein n=1 Tax=Kitasatospora sp. NBC_01250 TaxID=2903571 RepID=UPI002E35CA21|nr:hypothetical protein [Kitasatospora sp. NBC_01250]